MKTMKFHCTILFAFLLVACGGGGGDGGTGGSNSVRFADYFPVEPPAPSTSCTITDEVVFGSNIGQQSTTFIDGSTETINYTSGALTGAVVTATDNTATNTFVILNDGVDVKYLRYGDAILSTDCNLNAHPDAYSFGEITDGMVKDITTYSIVDVNNMANCSTVPNVTDPGNKALYKIVDVTVRGVLYEDAIVEYWLDIDTPFAALQYSGSYGIPIPNSTETQGGSVTDVSIYALDIGSIAHIGVEANDGSVTEIRERISTDCM